jgi:hypothetical protein
LLFWECLPILIATLEGWHVFRLYTRVVSVLQAESEDELLLDKLHRHDCVPEVSTIEQCHIFNRYIRPSKITIYAIYSKVMYF